MASIDDLKKLDIRIAKVLAAEDHPNAQKLLILKIDNGDRQKQIIAGIKNFYKKEELVGKYIVVIDNLEPVNLRGEYSEGMLLAAQDDEAISLLIPDRPIKEGSGVK